MINKDLREKFERIIEIKNISWNLIEQIVQKDANILRPIKGVAFEEFFKKILKRKKSDINIEDGVGDSDVDLVVNGFKLQLKTIDKGSTKENSIIGVALHKTHGNEKRPFNLYKKKIELFIF